MFSRSFPAFTYSLLALLCLTLIRHAHAYDPTDSLMDGDAAQSGYLPNHNMDPAIISGGSFGQLWRYQGPPGYSGQAEQFYAKPLVYTPARLGRQVVLTFSEQNRMYVLDAVNGTSIAFRDLSAESEPPFLVSDLVTGTASCNDITGTIGITGTPVIDPNTDTVYFWSKGYKAGGTGGWKNGVYRFHAVDALTLQERPGFPTNIEGAPADNDATRRFHGGSVLQRTSLSLINGVVVSGFGGHCDMFNYTGWVVSMSTAGQYLSGYSTSAGPGAPPQDGTWEGGGGGCGVWMAGMPLASDTSGRLFFATGNGYKRVVNQNNPASGKVHLDTLSECMVNIAVNSSGALVQQDYFQPSDYLAMDAGDRDLGSGGVALWNLGQNAGGVSRLAITCGKNGKCYVTNADNLGGYKLGPSGGDSIIQTITPPSGGALFCNVGVYPLEGGYLYLTPVGSPTYVYSLGYDSNGRPAFTLVAQTDDVSAARVGVGPATITTLNGQSGTGVLWVVDVDAGVRAYSAVPVNGKMQKITLPATPSIAKFQRPAFGNGRYYTTTSNGAILGFGAPVALPFDCSSPVDFGSVAIGSLKTITVNCTAKIAINTVRGLAIGKTTYMASNSSLPTGPLAAGAKFSFPVTFNLTKFTLNAGSSSAPSASPGIQTTALSIFTTNGADGYAIEQPITLTGYAVSNAPFVSMSPLQIDFPGIVIGAASANTGTTNSFRISNLGKLNMTIKGYSFISSNDDDDDDGGAANVTKKAGTYILDDGGYFTSTNLPPVGSVIVGGGAVTVNVRFLTNVVGSHFTSLTVWTNGGSAFSLLTGSASTSPIAVLERSTSEGGWVKIPNCAVPDEGCASQIDLGSSPGLIQRSVTLRLSNVGGSDLVITKSKPPVGTLGAASPETDFSEGLTIKPGSNTTAVILFSPGSSTLNADSVLYSAVWTFNNDDLSFGVHLLNFTASLVAKQVGPKASNGSSRFRYLGCYQDSVATRIEPTSYNNAQNDNGLCQTQALNYGVVFAASEYRSECWVGSNIPSDSLKVDESRCTTFICSGDSNQFCGGDGGYASFYYDSQKYNPANQSFIGNFSLPSNPASVGNYFYAGCFTDSVQSRTLGGMTVGASSTRSLQDCAAACAGYKYFGTEYANECYCSNTLGGSASKQPDKECNMLCAGNSLQFCGAGGRLTVYAQNGTAIPSSASSSTSSAPSSAATSGTPSSPAKIGNFVFSGCYSDAVAARTLQGSNSQAADLTLESCAAVCSGFQYFGTEYSQECYCGNSLLNGGAAVTDGRCNMLCAGNKTQICGGSGGMSVYSRASLNSSSSTSTSSAVTSSSSGSATTTGPPSAFTSSTGVPTCPSANGTVWITSNGKYALLECFIDHAAGDLATTYTDDYGQCANSCGSTISCMAFSWIAGGKGNPCYLKSSVGAPGSNGGVWGGKLIAAPVVSSNSSTARSTSTASSSSTVTSNYTITSSSKTTTSSMAATSSTATSTSSSATSTSSGSATTTTGPPPAFVSSTGVPTCPSANGTTWITTNGKNALLECFIDHAGGDLSMTYTDNYGQCANACGSTTSCLAFSWAAGGPQSPCYLKSSVGAPGSNAGVWGGKLVAAPVVSSNSSIATSTSTATSTSSSATSTSSSATSTGPSPAFTPSTGVPTCPNANGTTWITSNGKYVLLECFIDHAAGDLSTTYSDDYGQCANACGSTASCMAFSWIAGGPQSPCYLKSSVGAPGSNGGVWGGKLIAAPVVSSSSSSTSSTKFANTTSTVATTSSSLNSTTSTTSFVIASTTSFSTVSTSTATLSSVSNSTSSVRSTTSSSSSSTLTGLFFNSTTSTMPTSTSSTSLTLSSAASSWPSNSSSTTMVSSTSTSSSSSTLSTSSTTSSSSSSSSSATSTLSSSSSTSSAGSAPSTTKSSTSSTSSAGSAPSSTKSTTSSTSTTITTKTSTSTSSTKTSSTSTTKTSSTSTKGSAPTSTSTSTKSSAPTSTSMSSTSSSSNSSSTSVSNSTTSTSSISSTSSSSSSSTTVSSSSSTLTSMSSSTSASSSASLTTSSSSSSLSSSSSSITSSSSTTSTATSSTSSSTSTISSSSSSSSTTSSSSSSTASSSSSTTLSTLVTLTSTTSQSSSSSTSSSSTLSTSTLGSAPTSTPSAAATWQYLGCANDTTSARALGRLTTTSVNMTVELCQSYCGTNGYPLSGLESGNQCYCSVSLDNGAALGQTGCTRACVGNSAQICGGASRLSVYNGTSYVPAQTVSASNGYALQGCYTDSASARGLTTYSFTSTSMTVASCTSACAAKKYAYAGLEYGNKCYCAAQLAGTSLPAGAGECNLFCNGNVKTFCGGTDKLLVYKA